LGTLLFDLLEPPEPTRGFDGADRRRVFDIPLLARRLTEAIDLVRSQQALSSLPVGLFGASTGAAAALVASALRRDRVFAVVSRGGRPDLAHGALAAVTAPTLLIVGGADPDVIDLNEQAMRQLRAPVRLKLIPGASHLFEEPGALDQVADLTAAWFVGHLPSVLEAGPRGRHAADKVGIDQAAPPAGHRGRRTFKPSP
jgi:pimeloyl-ACP methyl ester carboxylesterase